MEYSILLTEKIGDNITSSENLADVLTGTGGLNEILGNICQAIGAIMFALAVYKVIMSMKDSNANDKAQASALFGGGVAAFMINTILDNLHYDDVSGDTASLGIFVQNIMTQMSQVMIIMGVLLFAIGVFQMITSYMNEQAAEKENSSRLMTTGAALIGSKTILQTIGNKYVTAAIDHTVRPFLEVAIDTLCGFARVSGFILFASSVYQMVIAFKDEDLSAKHHAAVMMSISAGLIAFDVILQKFLPGLVSVTIRGEIT